MRGRGERGPQGDHGQTGDTGLTGERGRTGATGEQGPRYSSWLTRHVSAAYGLLLIGVVLAFIFSAVRFDQVTDRIDRKARELCEAGNTRSQIQREDLETTAKQTQELDIERLLGITPEAAAEVRRLSKDNAERRIMRLPFLDCETGERFPPPTTIPNHP